jgi:hypothetical protein
MEPVPEPSFRRFGNAVRAVTPRRPGEEVLPQMRSETDQFNLRTAPAVRGEPTKTFPQGRTCAHPGCATQLSVYNAGAQCWTHEPEHRYRMLAGGRKRATA